MHIRRVLQVSLATVIALPAMIAAAPASPFPHLALKRSEPAGGSQLTTAPTRISLWFTAKPERAFSHIRLLGPGAAGEVSMDSVVADSSLGLHAEIRRPLSPGGYRVVWQTASADGHPIRGEFAFTVLGDTSTTRPAADTASHDSHAAPDTAHSPSGGHHAGDPLHSENRVARWMEFVALLTALGVLGFRHGVLPPLASRGVPVSDALDRARRFGQSAVFIYILAALSRLYTEATAVAGRGLALDPATLKSLLTTTTWGAGWTVGALGALVLAAGWWLSKRSVTIGTPLALTGGLAIALSPALTGHAAATGNFIVSVTLDVLHVLSAGLWLGGLLLVLIAGIPAMLRLSDGNTHAAVSALVNSFHPIALFCAPLAVVSGLGSAWTRLGGPAAITSTAYGRILLLKLGLFVAVAAIALYNSSKARRQLGTPAATARMRWSGVAELVVAALVVAATTVLVTTPIPVLRP